VDWNYEHCENEFRNVVLHQLVSDTAFVSCHSDCVAAVTTHVTDPEQYRTLPCLIRPSLTPDNLNHKYTLPVFCIPAAIALQDLCLLALSSRLLNFWKGEKKSFWAGGGMMVAYAELVERVSGCDWPETWPQPRNCLKKRESYRSWWLMHFWVCWQT